MASSIRHGGAARERQDEVGTMTTSGVAGDRAGFSFVEVLIALAILLSALGAFAQIAAAGQRLARSQSEATDLHQRVRVAVERIRKDLAQAGAGVVRGPASALPGPLTNYVAPILPARLGSRLPDAALSAFSDRVSIFYAAEGAWPSPLTVPMATVDQPLFLDPSVPGCPGVGLCGFEEGTRALLIDTRGAGAGHEVFTVNGVAGSLLHDAPNPRFERAYAAGNSTLIPVVQRTYYFDRPNRRLMLYDGHLSDMPLVDNVVNVEFSFFVDNAAASVARPPDGGSNCVYNPGSPPLPRLGTYATVGLHLLTAGEMADGPVCGAGGMAFDGDLLRIRLVRVSLRLDAAADDVRGSGGLFARPGRSSSGYSHVPDFEVTFDVAPRNMAPAPFAK
jgi:prepilin-type N-terminal cleavage/methylation domain-containing protein